MTSAAAPVIFIPWVCGMNESFLFPLLSPDCFTPGEQSLTSVCNCHCHLYISDIFFLGEKKKSGD